MTSDIMVTLTFRMLYCEDITTVSVTSFVTHETSICSGARDNEQLPLDRELLHN